MSQEDKDSADSAAGKVIAAGGIIGAVHGANKARKGIIHQFNKAGNLAKKAVNKGQPNVPRPKGASIRKGGAIALIGAAAFSVGHHMINRPYKHHQTPYNENS